MSPQGANFVDLRPFLSPDRTLLLAAGTDKATALEQLSTACSADPKVSDPVAFRRAILDRERVSSTGIGGGIAVPHAKIASNTGFTIAIGVSDSGIDFDAKDGQPVHILVMIAANDKERDTYLKVLATVAGRLKQAGLCDRLRQLTDPVAILDAFAT